MQRINNGTWLQRFARTVSLMTTALIGVQLAFTQNFPEILWRYGSLPIYAYPDFNFSADKQYVMTYGEETRVFRVADEQIVRMLNNPVSPFSSGAYVADVSPHNSRQVRVWRTSDWQIEHTFEVDSSYTVVNLNFTPNGQNLLITRRAGATHQIEVRRALDWEVERVLNRTYGSSPSIRFSPDGSFLLVGDSAIDVWRCSDWQYLHTLTPGGSTVAVSSTGLLAAADRGAGATNSLRVWSILSGQLVTTLTLNQGTNVGSVSLAFSPDGRWLASLGRDFEIWDSTNNWRRTTLAFQPGIAADSSGVTFSPDGQYLVSGATSGGFWQFAPNQNRWIRQLSLGPSVYHFRTNTDLFGIVIHATAMSRIEFPGDSEIYFPKVGAEPLASVAYARLQCSQEGFYSAVTARDLSNRCTSFVYNRNGHRIYRYEPLGCISPVFSFDSKLVALASATAIQVRELPSGALTRTIDVSFSSPVSLAAANAQPVCAVLHSPNSSLQAELIDLNTGNTVLSLPIVVPTVGTNFPEIFFSPSDEWLIVSFSGDGFNSGQVDVYRISDGARIFGVQASPSPTKAALSPNGSLLGITVDNEIHLYCLIGGGLVRSLTGHTNTVRSISFSPDGAYLLSSAFEDGGPATIRLWRVSDGLLIQEYDEELGRGIHDLRFSPTGDSFFYIGFNHYGLARVELPPSACGDVNRDGCTDDADLLAVLFAFGQPNSDCDLPEDLNSDGIVDDADLLTVLFCFGTGC